MKAAFLIRCSTKKQDYQRQIDDLTEYCKENGLTNTPDLIFGEHITGKDDATVKDRESIAQLKEAIGTYDVVLISEASRLSRDATSGRMYVRQFINWNIPVYFLDADVWTINPNTGEVNRNAESTLGGFFDGAAKYLASMKIQIASGRRSKLEESKMSIGKPFFGYKRVGKEDFENKGRLILDENKVPEVEFIYNEYLKEGATLKSTALATSDKFGHKFSIGMIEHILTYEAYHKGYNEVYLTNPTTGKKKYYKVKMPTIIDESIFIAAKTKRENNRSAKRPYAKQKVYCLSRLIKCSECGHSFTPRKRGEKGGKRILINGNVAISWLCMAGVNNINNCSLRIALNNDKIEPIIWELIKNELITKSKLNEDERKEKLKNIEYEISTIESRKKNYEAELNKLDSKVNKAYSAFLDAPENLSEVAKKNYYSIAEQCEKDKATINNQIEVFTNDLDKLELKHKYYLQPQLPNDVIEKAESDYRLKRDLFLELIDKIVPYPITTYKTPSKTKLILRFGVVMLVVYTVDSVYNIFFDANQKSKMQKAYYMNSSYSTFIPSNGSTVEQIHITAPYLIMDSTEPEEYITMNEFVKLADDNNQILTFKY